MFQLYCAHCKEPLKTGDIYDAADADKEIAVHNECSELFFGSSVSKHELLLLEYRSLRHRIYYYRGISNGVAREYDNDESDYIKELKNKVIIDVPIYDFKLFRWK